MRRRLLVGVVLFVCLFAASSVLAVEFSFTPRAELGTVNYQLEWKENGFPLFDLDSYMAVGTLGGTVGVDRFYFDAYFQTTTEGSEDNDWGAGTIEWDFDFIDYSFTLGFNVIENLSVYAGWKGRETNIDGRNESRMLSLDESFESDGFFGGVAYGLIFDPGVLSFNAAYVRLNGEMEANHHYDWGFNRHFRAKDATSDGFTVGVGWKGFIGERLSYTIKADYYRYSFDDFDHEYSDDFTPWVATTNTNEVDEQALAVRAGIAYTF